MVFSPPAGSRRSTPAEGATVTDLPQFSEEATNDEYQEEAEALSGPTTDPGVIESIVGETIEGDDTAVVYPTDPHHGSLPHNGADGTDAEAIFEDENRELDNLEGEISEHRSSPADLVDLHDIHAEGHG